MSDEMEIDEVRPSLPWVEKYRPSSLEELIAQDDIVTILNQLIDNQKLPHLLFHGPPGTGKTSTILAAAKKMYGEHYTSMALELNASDDRGIDVVREQIKEFAGTKKLWSTGIKLIILDEADAMTNDAQAALRRVIEKYTSNTRFCLICNYVNKIIPALQSRCTKFRFSPLDPALITDRLQFVIDSEKVNATPDGIQALLRLSNGDMRRVLNLLQATALAFPVVSEENVYKTAGAALPSVINSIFSVLLNGTFIEAYQFILNAINECGYALCDIITELTPLIIKKSFPDKALALLLERLSVIELRLASGASEKIQVSSLVGIFITIRNMM